MATIKQLENDKTVYRRLVKGGITHMEKLWLLDVGGDYQIYRLRLRALARDHQIPCPDDPIET